MKPHSISRLARTLRLAALCAASLLATAATTNAVARQGQLAAPSSSAAVNGAGHIWRCEQAGKVSYSTTPCPAARGAKALETLEPRSAADVQQAQQRAAQERKAADALTREREAREARQARQLAMQTRPANLGPEKARPAPPKAEKASAREGRRHSKRGLKKPPAGETWRAVVPGSRRKRG